MKGVYQLHIFIIERAMKKRSAILIVFFALSGCANLTPPKERVASWDDWELCQRLADYVFKGNSKWLWYSSAEISNRGLQNEPRCKSVYDSRIAALQRENEKSTISISFGEAMNSNSSFEKAAGH